MKQQPKPPPKPTPPPPAPPPVPRTKEGKTDMRSVKPAAKRIFG